MTTSIARILIDPSAGTRELPSDYGQLFTTGRNDYGHTSDPYDRVTVRVTIRGHWYRKGDVRDGLHNDTICRGCGHHGHFDYILDNKDCAQPATAADVQAALAGPARQAQPGDEIRTTTQDGDGRVLLGTVARIYRDDTGAKLVEVKLTQGRGTLIQLLEYMTSAY